MVELNSNFKYAIRDLVYLLDRNYPRKSSIELVGNRYMLSKDERLILFRGVFSREICKQRRKKSVNVFNNDKNIIIVDGLNVLITIISYLSGRIVFKALDGFVRDISGVYGNFTYSKITEKAMEMLIKLLSSIIDIKSGMLFFYLDYNASKTLDFSRFIHEQLLKADIENRVIVEKNCDYLIVKKAEELRENCVVATSDTVIIDKTDFIIDLPLLLFKKILKKDILDLKRISGFRFGNQI